MQNTDLPKRDLQAVMDVLWNPAKDLLDFEVEEKSDTFLKIRVSRCLFAEEMRKQEASEIGFAFYCAYDYGFCEGLNPKIKFTRTFQVPQIRFRKQKKNYSYPLRLLLKRTLFNLKSMIKKSS